MGGRKVGIYIKTCEQEGDGGKLQNPRRTYNHTLMAGMYNTGEKMPLRPFLGYLL